MIKYFLSIFLLIMLFSVPSIAGDPRISPPVGGGEICDWSIAKASITETESGGNYSAIGPDTRYGRPLGKYQFIPPTLNRMIDQNPNCNAQSCRSQNANCSRAQCANEPLLSSGCYPAQECLMDALLADNLNQIRNSSDCQALLNSGREVSGCGQGRCLSCPVTESGLLAAYHLGGADECTNLLIGSGDSDNTGTSTAYYTCKHGGLPVPGNCTPRDYGSTGTPAWENPPTLTNDQLEFMDESGDRVNVNPNAFKYTWVGSLSRITNQLTALMISQTQMFGMFFDAKHQLETQRLLQQKTAEASKKYHPSKQMCTFGTFVRDLGISEQKMLLTQAAVNKSVMDRSLLSGDVSTYRAGSHQETRLKKYKEKFCDQRDNAGQNNDLCEGSVEEIQRNADIDFTKTLYAPLTLEVDLTDNETTQDEENLFAFLDHMFVHDAFPWMPPAKTKLARFQQPYMEMRSLTAIRSVAQNSFAHIIAEKSEGPSLEEGEPAENAVSAAPFLKAMMVDMGIQPSDVEEMIGENPSYYAQMELLTRKIYMHPDFVANLYDKPANVKRMAAAITAIKSMQNWQIHQALQRREMLFSVLLELKLREKQRELQANEIPEILYGDIDYVGPR